MIDTNELAGIGMAIERGETDELNTHHVVLIRDAVKEIWASREAADELERLRASEAALKRELLDALRDIHYGADTSLNELLFNSNKTHARFQQLQSELGGGS